MFSTIWSCGRSEVHWYVVCNCKNVVHHFIIGSIRILNEETATLRKTPNRVCTVVIAWLCHHYAWVWLLPCLALSIKQCVPASAIDLALIQNFLHFFIGPASCHAHYFLLATFLQLYPNFPLKLCTCNCHVLHFKTDFTQEHPQIRLEGGISPVEGRVEMFLQGQWRTICNNYWDIRVSQVHALSYARVYYVH